MPAGATYSTIATTTLSTSSSIVTFSSLGSYTDIVFVYNGTASDFVNIGLRFNSDSGGNYSYTRIYGSPKSSDRTTNFTYAGFGIIGTSQSTAIAHVMNYAGGTYKSVLGRGNTSLYVSTYCSTWRNTAAITSISVVTGSGNFGVGSTFTLYGIASA